MRHPAIITCPCLLIAALLTASILISSCNDNPVADPAPESQPKLTGTLESHCYAWPEQAFSPENMAVVEAGLTTGSPAADFALEDIDGNTFQLSELLKSKPVLLVLGAYT